MFSGGREKATQTKTAGSPCQQGKFEKPIMEVAFPHIYYTNLF